MIEVETVRIFQEIPGVADKYVLEYRVYDPTKGKRLTDDGFEVWNYDKAMIFSDNDLDRGIERLEEILGERLSS